MGIKKHGNIKNNENNGLRMAQTSEKGFQGREGIQEAQASEGTPKTEDAYL